VRDESHRKLTLYLNDRWVLQDNVRQLLDLVWHRRREKHRLSLSWYRSNDLPNIRHKAHVEHPISLVEHQELDAREIHRVAMDVVHESSWARYDDAWVSAQLRNLIAV
jgi:hypothetical protein